MKSSGIIVAAGKGKRFGGKKQFEKLGSGIVLDYSVFAFRSCVDEIIIVTSIEDAPFVKRRYGVTVVEGGKRRMDSVFNGLREARGEYVIIHDAVRPLITSDKLKKILSLSEQYKASIYAVPIKDTLKIVEKNMSVHTVDRRGIYAAQTPQAFKKSTLIKAYEMALSTNEEYTDESSIWEKFIGPVHVVEGEHRNIKITTREDLKIVKCLLESE